MALGNTVTTATAILKNYYSKDQLEMELYDDHPVLGLIEKDGEALEKITGLGYVQPILWGAGQAASASFSIAQTMSTKVGNLPSSFVVPLKEDNAVATITTELLKKSKTKEGAFADESTLIIDEQLQNMRRRLARQVFRTSTGQIGQIGTIGNGLTTNSRVTMKNTRDIVNIEVGQQLDLAATDGGTKLAYGSNAHGLYVIAVDPDNGWFDVGTTPTPYNGANAIAVTNAADGIPTAASTNFIYVAGDLNAVMSGFQDWLPATVASNDSFYGVNRSLHRVRLAGHYIDGTIANSNTAAILLAAARIKNQGGKANTAVVDPIRFAQIELEQEDKRRLVDVRSTNSVVGYDGIEIATGAGRITVVADMDCPSTEMFVIDTGSWILASIDDPVGIWSEDGLTWLRAGQDNGMEVRLYGIRNLICKMPRNNARVVMTSSN